MTSTPDTRIDPVPWSMVVVTVPHIRYGGSVKEMSPKEGAMAKIIADQYPAIMAKASRGRLAIQARTVVHDDVYDLDQFIADNHTDIRRQGNGGIWMSQGLARPVTDPYGAATARGTIIIVGQSQLDQKAAGLTLNEGGRRFSSIQVSDGGYDEYVGKGRLDDVLVHETGHQFQGATRDAGQKQAANAGDTGYGNPDWGRVAPYAYTDDPVINWFAYLRVLYDLIDDDLLAAYVDAHPAVIDGPFQPLVPFDLTDAYAPVTTAPEPGGTPPVTTEPTPIRMSIDVTVAGGNGVVVETNAATLAEATP